MARENGSDEDRRSDEENDRERKRDRGETVRDLNPEWADPKHLDLICIRRRCLPAPFVPVKISRREERTRSDFVNCELAPCQDNVTWSH